MQILLLKHAKTPMILNFVFCANNSGFVDKFYQ